MTDLKALEHSTLKVPYEILNKKYRVAQKTIDREISHVQLKSKFQHATTALETLLTKDPLPTAELNVAVDVVLEKLDVLAKKSSSALAEETEAATVIKKRIEHLKVSTDPNAPDASVEQWRRLRVDRLIVEYLLRAGYYRTATQLAERTGLSYMSNLSVFLTAQEVRASLEARDTTRCLQWCHDNKSKLRRLKSRLELRVRQQEFIELIRKGLRSDAVTYARTHFSAYDGTVWKEELESVIGLLAFGPSSQVPAHQALFSDERWKVLMKEFESENFRLFQLAHQSVFSACMQTGLSALKTPHCQARPHDDRMEVDSREEVQDRKRRKQCPVCDPAVFALARPLPYAHAGQSRLICAYSGEPLNENNPPLMLPNGMVYGRKALQELALQSGNGTVTCPRTGHRANYDSAQRVYVM